MSSFMHFRMPKSLISSMGIAVLAMSSMTFHQAPAGATQIHKSKAQSYTATTVEKIFRAADYGVTGNGRTDDRGAILRAIGAASRSGGGVVLLPNSKMRMIASRTSAWTELPDNVTLRGSGSLSEIAMTGSDGEFYSLFRIVGNNVRIENLRLTRVSDLYGVMLDVRGVSGFSLKNVTLDGKSAGFSREFHGILLYGNAPDRLSNSSIMASTIRDCEFALFQPSERTLEVSGFSVTDSLFEGNFASDLEFNAPNSDMRNISVSSSTFRNNRSSTHSAGFGVGLANVHGATVRNNSFTNYPLNPIHIEDRSSEVQVTGNRFVNVSTMATNYASAVIVLSGASNITVVGNSFDARRQGNVMNYVYGGPGGPYARPKNLLVTGNVFYLRSGVTPIGDYGVDGYYVSKNTLKS